LLAPVLARAATVGRFRVSAVTYPGGGEGFVAGTGYTGEDGVELHVPAAEAAGVWRAVLDAGIAPAGLGARDTLRLEAGLPLHGHELGAGISPLQAGLGWVVRFDKGDFRGRDALAAERERGVARKLRGLTVAGRQIPRQGCAVFRGDDRVGEVTSGNFSPTLGHGIALAFVPPDAAPGDAFDIDVRGRRVPATVAELPFLRR
jgi:aminomethyltransferase